MWHVDIHSSAMDIYKGQLMSNPLQSNQLEDPSHNTEPQGEDWDTISIAVRPDFKKKFKGVAGRLGLKPSQYGRMVLHDAVTRAEAA
jgi:hypothetical protein